MARAQDQYVILYNLAGYEFQSCAYDRETSADWFLGYVRGLGSHRWSRKVPLTAQGLKDHWMPTSHPDVR